jgi:hypothetical protein
MTLVSPIKPHATQLVLFFTVANRPLVPSRSPDMLEIGNGALTLAEQRSHFALWALLKSPLIIGSDVRALPADSLAILQNEHLIEVNQDDLGIQGTLRASTNYDGTRRIISTKKLTQQPGDDADEVQAQAPAQDDSQDPQTTLASDTTPHSPPGPNGTSAWIAHCSFGASSASIVAAQQWEISADRKTLLQQAAKGSSDASNKCLARSANGKTVVVTSCNDSVGSSSLTKWAFGDVDTTVSQVRDPADAGSCLAFNGTSLHMEPCRTETSDQKTPADCARSRCRFSSLIYQQWYLNSLQQMTSAFTNIHNNGSPLFPFMPELLQNTPRCLATAQMPSPPPPSPPPAVDTNLPLQVWAGPLSGGDVAVVLLNMGNKTSTITANLADIGLKSGGTVKVTDLWTGKIVGTMKGSVSASVETHDSAAFRVQLLGSSSSAPPAVL